MDQDITVPAVQPDPRVRFGTADHQDMPMQWAEKGLCWLYEYRRQVFADMMLAVMDTGLSTANRRRDGANGRPS